MMLRAVVRWVATLMVGSIISSGYALELSDWNVLQLKQAHDSIVEALVPDGMPGAVVASPSRASPNYYRNWKRDASKVFRTLLQFYVVARRLEGGPIPAELVKPHISFSFLHAVRTMPVNRLEKYSRIIGLQKAEYYERHLWNMVGFMYHIQNTYAQVNRLHPDIPDIQLAEAFYEVDGTATKDQWGVPQLDGAALEVPGLVEFAKWVASDAELKAAWKAVPPVQDDIEHGRTLKKLPKPMLELTQEERLGILQICLYRNLRMILRTWNLPGIDIWEETYGRHFFGYVANLEALNKGASFIRKNLGEAPTLPSSDGKAQIDFVEALEALETQIQSVELKKFEAPASKVVGGPIYLAHIDVPAERKPPKKDLNLTDIQVMLSALYSPSRDPYKYGVLDPTMIRTQLELESLFRDEYPVNRDHRLPGQIMGRWRYDPYDGVAVNHDTYAGGWLLSMLEAAQFWSRHLWARQQYGITEKDLDIGIQDNFVLSEPMLQLKIEGFLRRVMYHAPNGRLPEQVDRTTGYFRGAPDLKWSAAAYWASIVVIQPEYLPALYKQLLENDKNGNSDSQSRLAGECEGNTEL